jgi:serine-type D-Ala-D-Ala carboxypeptidase/endopeptidase
LLVRSWSKWPNPYGHFTDLRLIKSLRRISPNRMGPRQVVRYSNLGYAVLGLALSVAAGQEFEDLMRQRVLHPLGMTHSSFFSDLRSESPLARGYDRFGVRVSAWRNATFSPSGGLRATAGDVERLLRAFLAPERSPLRSAIELALEPIVIDDLLTVGLGWQLKLSAAHHHVYWHNGSTAGFGASMAIYPKRNRGVGVLASTAHRREMDELAMLVIKS